MLSSKLRLLSTLRETRIFLVYYIINKSVLYHGSWRSGVKFLSVFCVQFLFRTNEKSVPFLADVFRTTETTLDFGERIVANEAVMMDARFYPFKTDITLCK